MDYQTNIDYSENTVFDQEPRAGAKIEPAETVRLWVSKGTGPMTLIKVIGDSVGEAVRDLEAMGLRVDTLELEDPVQPAGQIIDQNPVAGSEITPGTRVILFVSKGPAVEQIPNLENRPVLAAMNIISQLGWLASTSEEASEIIPAGLVIRTEPPAQSKLSPGNRVEIIISGSYTLANVLTAVMDEGCVAACGNAQGMDLPASVAPFILRGVTLRGVHSVYVPRERRITAWERLAQDLKIEHLDEMTKTINLEEVIETANDITDGQIRGRTVVDLNS